MWQSLVERFGIVRIRQIIEDVRHRLVFVPVMLVIVAVLASQVTVWIDRSIGDLDVPGIPETSLDSSRPILATIAGGLITSVTLLLSMMLVAVQIASSNFSPRTLRNWLGDTTIRWSVGIVIATAVFCLLSLRSVRTEPDGVDSPSVTVLLAVVLALVSLVAVIRAVDHVTKNMQVGSIARRLVQSTLTTLDSSHAAFANQRPAATALPAHAERRHTNGTDGGVLVLESTSAGWVQQIDEDTLLEALPPTCAAWIVVAHGDFVTLRSPLLHVDVDGTLDEAQEDAIRKAFALGETRTMQQDVGFGLAQLSDIAVRAMSPGVNDPETAREIVLSLGEVLRGIWSTDSVDESVERDGRTIHRLVPGHRELLLAALDPIRRYASSDVAVMTAMASVVRRLRHETERCELPGGVEALDEFLDDLAESADVGAWLERERDEFAELTDVSNR